LIGACKYKQFSSSMPAFSKFFKEADSSPNQADGKKSGCAIIQLLDL